MLETHNHAGTRLSMSEVFALGELSGSEAISQQDLADRLGLEKSTVSRLASNLERRGWLTRDRDAANRRFYRLGLTSQGREAARQIGGHFKAYHAALLRELTPDERTGLEVGLTGLIRALESMDRSRGETGTR
jgi:DNA-binding MarR family transcriptional regulator